MGALLTREGFFGNYNWRFLCAPPVPVSVGAEEFHMHANTRILPLQHLFYSVSIYSTVLVDSKYYFYYQIHSSTDYQYCIYLTVSDPLVLLLWCLGQAAPRCVAQV